MKKTILIMTVLLMTIALPIIVQGQQLFDFNGQALVPETAGEVLSVYGIIYDPSPGTTPIPLYFDTNEYTLVIDGLVLAADGSYSGGTVTIYEDAATAAVYTDIATFTDGANILSGVVTTFQRIMFTGTLGSVFGNMNWTDGDLRYENLDQEDRVNWSILAAINSTTNFTEPGYSENWDGKVEPKEVIANEATTWSNVKSMFR